MVDGKIKCKSKMKRARISDENLSAIRNGLPHGAIKQIAQRCGVNPVYVSRVLLGGKGQGEFDLKIFMVILDVFAEYQVHNKIINKKIELLINEIKSDIEG